MFLFFLLRGHVIGVLVPKHSKGGGGVEGERVPAWIESPPPGDSQAGAP